MVPSDIGPREDSLRLLLTASGIVLLLAGLLGVLYFLATLLGVLIWLAVVVLLVHALGWRRRIRSAALLDLLAVSAEKSMPLEPAVEALAEEAGGRFGRRLAAMAGLMRSGLPLAEAAEQTGAPLSEQGLLAVRVGHVTGDLGRAIQDAAAAETYQEPVWQAALSRFFYLAIVLCFALLLSGYLAYRIAPQLVKIFDDFNMSLPPLTQRLIDVSEFLLHSGILLLAVGLLLAAALYLTLHYMGWLSWGFPGVNRQLRRLDTAAILRSLALATAQNQPLLPVMKVLAEVYPKPAIRRRLGRAVAEMELGRPWWDALRSQGLVRDAEAAILESAERAGNLTWALRELADGSARRLAYRLQAIIQLVFPFVVLALGILVGLFVVGYFLPIVRIIQALV